MTVQITTRQAKGSPLSNVEQDANIVALRDAIDALAGQVTGGVFVTGFEQDPDSRDLTISYSDGTIIGPISLPVKALRPRGAWQTGTTYDVADVVRQAGSGYIVASAHLSGVFATDLGAGRLTLLAERGTDGTIQEAPTDGETYGRKLGQWVALAGADGGMFRDRGVFDLAVATGDPAERYLLHDVVTEGGRLWAARVNQASSVAVGGQPIIPGGELSDYDWLCLSPFTDAANSTDSDFFARRLHVVGIDGTTLKTLPEVIDELKGVSGVIVEAPADGSLYGRQDGDWVEVPVGIEDAPADGKQYSRQDGEWAEVETSGGGSTPGAFVNKGAWDFNETGYELNDVVDYNGRFWVCVTAGTVENPAFRHPNPTIHTVDWRCLTPMIGGENTELPGLDLIYGYNAYVADGLALVSLATILQTLTQRIQDLEAA